MEEISAKLKTESQLLQLTRSKTQSVVEKGNLEKILRHKEALGKVVSSLEELKVQAEKAKLAAGESVEDVEKWGAEIEQRVDEADDDIIYLGRCLKEAATTAENEKREKENILLARQREEELKFEKEKLEQKAKMQLAEQAAAKPAKSSQAKMPKLVITKYDGTYEKWLSFWNKFEAEIDSTDLPAVTKFAHLKELLEANVCQGIDGLPFTTEGYERAKNILKSNYGKVSEIIKAYVENIQTLPVVTGTQPSKIHKFCQTLNYNVQSLETLGKLSDCMSMVRGILDKLPGIKAELVSNKVGWQDWGFAQLLQALEDWKAIHPVEISSRSNEKPPPPRQRSLYAQEQVPPTRGCVYCDDMTHKSFECHEVTSPADRRRKLQTKKLCFNCTGSKHHAAQCRSRTSCFHCKGKHHSSICERASQPAASGGAALTATHEGEKVCHPIVLVKVNGVTCRALLDTGATVSYASGYILDRLKLAPTNTLTRRIQTIVGIVTKRIETYGIQVSDTKGKCVMPVCATRVDRGELLTVDNPNYAEMISKYPHLKGVYMEDTDTKSQLPVHIILGASEYAKIKTRKSQRTGAMGQPVAEHTRFGWTIMTSGGEANLDNMFLTQTAMADYEELCRMDVLGLEDKPSGDQNVVHAEFLEQLHRDPEGWYETGLPWKGDHAPLPSNKAGSLKRLGNLVQRLKKTGRLDEYDAIIQDQLEEGIVEEAEMPPTGREFYIPHKAVIRENAETTKMRIVYDASAKANDSVPSLNDCLEIGPPLQKKLWEVLVRGRFHAVALAGDIRKAFLQVRIRPEHRDSLRFHWLDAQDPQRVCTLRFTRALFGLGPSPFLLGGVIQHHLNVCRPDYPECVGEIERELYVDDLLTGGPTVEQVLQKKEMATEIFSKATFQLHKWNSNVKELELTEVSESEEDLSYAKQQLGAQPRQCGLLGLKWDKLTDEIGVVFPTSPAQPTKRGILGKVAKIYDPLGLVAPTILQGKLLYREACDEKCGWDAPLSAGLVQKWQKWESGLPQQVNTSRSLAPIREPIEEIALHAFGDASGKGVAAAVYAVITQPTGVNQSLVAAKARLAKQGLTIPRLELVSGHMAVNLLSNVRDAIQGFPVTSLHCWLDSSVALHWVRGAGDYKQFVGNRVRKIREHDDVKWRHVPTQENPADLASRGGLVNAETRLWWNGPEWLSDRAQWPPDIVTQASAESTAEAKATKQLFALAVAANDELDDLLSKTTYWRTLRVSAWIFRFARNARSPKPKTRGPLTTKEIEEQERFWVLRAQHRGAEKLEEDRLRLNLQGNDEGMLECRGRVQGHYPIYIPDSSSLAEKLVQHAHKATLHGGVGLTMAKVRERHWIPRLRRLVKRVIKQCHGCKRFQAIAYAAPPPANLPITRTEGTTAFQVIGIDYAGPLRYRISKGREGKSYVLLYACSFTRGIYLDLLPNLEMTECQDSLERFIARRGRPERIYSDNGATFIGAAKWVKAVMRDEQLQGYLAKNGIKWQFNLSRAPWWGGQFERMVGLMKAALYKVIGNGFLTWKELEKVLLSVEITLNDRPLGYVEDDVQYPVITPNSLLFVRPSHLLQPQPHLVQNTDLRKRYKYLLRCKEAMWTRWTREYLRSLRERHASKRRDGCIAPHIGDVVIIKSEERNRGKWRLGIVTELIAGRDGVVRAAKLRAGKSFIERAVQQLYPLELTCDKEAPAAPQPPPQNPEARPKRNAAIDAARRIAELSVNEL